MRKILFSIAMIFAIFFSSCATFQNLKEGLPLFARRKDYTSENKNENKSQSEAESKSETKKRDSVFSMPTYKAPEDYSASEIYRNNKPFAAMKNIPASIEKFRTVDTEGYVNSVCQIINENAKNDFEKVKMANDIVALLVRYDADGFWNNEMGAQDWESVLQNKLAVCEGYSNALKKFLDKLKIKNKKVVGYARGVGSNILAEENPNASNHAWNIAEIEGAWYIIDCTWNSGFMKGRKSVQEYTTDWLFVNPNVFIYSHFPETSAYQLLEEPISGQEFTELPDLRPLFFDNAKDFSDFKKNNFASNSFEVDYVESENGKFSFSVASVEGNITREVKNSTYIKKDAEKSKAVFSFPKAKTYLVRIFFFKNGKSMGQGCGEFSVTTEKANTVRYPTFFSAKKEVELIEPIEMPLKSGSSVNFAARAEYKFCAVIVGKQFNYLEKDENGVFRGTVQIPTGIKSVNISFTDTEKGSYSTYANYEVK